VSDPGESPSPPWPSQTMAEAEQTAMWPEEISGIVMNRYIIRLPSHQEAHSGSFWASFGLGLKVIFANTHSVYINRGNQQKLGNHASIIRRRRIIPILKMSVVLSPFGKQPQSLKPPRHKMDVLINRVCSSRAGHRVKLDGGGTLWGSTKCEFYMMGFKETLS